jgi:4-amino-4-deoxy-L-arabinose transferase-like glycosyltransferase
MFEARRPIPDGALALTLVGVAIFLSSNRPLLRSTPRMLQGAAIVNVGACLAWYLAASFASPSASDGVAGHLIGQLLLAGVVGTIGLVPVALTQNAAMDRLGVPPAPELP